MKKIAVLCSQYLPIIDALKYLLTDCEIDYLDNLKNESEYNLVILLNNYQGTFSGNALTCHYSLLPAFDTDEPIKQAILSGVKVTGLTIYFTNSKKIIAQYPIFIRNDMHYEDLLQELTYAEQTILPLVVKKIINNEQFEISELIN